MWTPTTREQHSRKALRYQTDLTDPGLKRAAFRGGVSCPPALESLHERRNIFREG